MIVLDRETADAGGRGQGRGRAGAGRAGERGRSGALRGGPKAGKEQKKSNQPSVIRVRGGDLKYSEAERKAVMRGGVLGTVVAETGNATSVSHEVEVTLLPPGKAAGRNAGQAQVDRMTARGHVVLTSRGPSRNRGAVGLHQRDRGVRPDRNRRRAAQNDRSDAGNRLRRGFDFPWPR